MKKAIALFLVAAMLTGALSACGGSTENDTETESGTVDTEPIETEPEETEPEETEPETLSTGLAEADYEEATICFLISDGESGDTGWQNREIAADEETAEAINDAVYRRNIFVEDKYNVKITWEYKHYNDMPNTIRKMVKGGTAEFACCMETIGKASESGMNGHLYDLNTLDNFDFSAPWWDQTIRETSTIANRMFYAVGDLNMLTNDGTAAMFFNKQLIENYNLENPYTLVNEGKWTIDKYTEMTEVVTDDLNGDGILGKEDIWGSLSAQDTVWSLIVSCGGSMAYKDENDLPVFHTLDEHYVDILNKIAACSNVGKTYNAQYSAYNGGRPDTQDDIFGTNRALFESDTVRVIHNLREMETNFGIIPYPKYDEAQEKYISAINTFASSTVTIPSTVQELEMVTCVLEEMACKSREMLRPAYYETTLQGQLARDEESTKMLDLIFANRVLDLGWANKMGDVAATIVTEIVKGTNDFASAFKKIEKAGQEKANKLIKAYTGEEA